MDRSLVDRVADDLAATRAELAGLALLLAGGVVLSVLVVAGVPGTVGGTAVPAPSAPAPVVPTGSPEPTGPAASTTPSRTVVHVTGAVRAPAVVELPPGARLVDAVGAAGGARSDAALDALNLAQVVVDGQRVHVPTTDEAAAAADVAGPLDPGTGLPATGGPGDGTGSQPEGPGAGSGARTADGLLDLNRATAADLEELPGVGPVLAGRILARRDEQGPFTEVGELRDVSGIGEATFQDLAPLVVVP